MIGEILYRPKQRAAVKQELGHPSSGIIGWAGGSGSVAGVAVDENSALNYSAVWAATRLLAATGSCLPLNLYRRRSDGGKDVDSTNPLYAVLHDAPNPEMSSMSFRLQAIAQQVNRGNCYAEIQRDGRGRVEALWPIHATRVTPERRDGALRYLIWSEGGRRQVPLAADDVFHVPSLISDDGLLGRGVIQHARESIGFGLATERHGAAYFGNGARPNVVVTHPRQLSQEARQNFRREWKEIHGGPDKAGELALLQEGADVKILNVSPEDSQFLECCVPETLVTLADGTRKRCDQLTIADMVLGWDGTRLVPSALECIRDNGVHPLIRITTHRGRVLVTTRNHPYLASKRQRCAKCSRRHGLAKHGLECQWIRADELSVGDYVRTGLRFTQAEPVHVEASEAWYVGAMVGDGYCRGKQSIGFSNTSAGVIAKMTAFAEARGMKIRQKVSYPTDWYFVGRDKSDKYQQSIARMALMPYDVLGKGAHEKGVPDRIQKATALAKSAFIAGLWDTDGTVSKEDARQPRLALATTSRSLADGTQHLLASLGIQSSIARQGEAGTKVVQGRLCNVRACWQLIVCGKSQAKRFAELIGPHLAEERKGERVRRFAEADLGNEEHGDFFEYDRIIKLEELSPSRTIALTVAGTHSHITNGLITHNTRQFNINEIARWYGVPPHMIGDLTRSTNNNIEHQGMEFVVYSLLPWLKLWEQEIWRKLIPRNERQSHYAKHVVDALLRGDAASRASALQTQFQNGALNEDEWREIEDRNPLPDGLGKRFYVAANLARVDAEPEPVEIPMAAVEVPDDEDEPEEPTEVDEADEDAIAKERRLRAALRGVLADTVARCVRKEAKAATWAATKPELFGKWLDQFYADHGDHMKAAVTPTWEACIVVGTTSRADLMVASHVQESRDLLLLACECQPEQLRPNIESCVASWDKRAERFAELVLGGPTI